jgi:hypothetical protein
MTKQLIKGSQLTKEQKSMLKFKGMQNEAWVNNHSFYFIDNKPATTESGLYYPVCNSLTHLPY